MTEEINEIIDAIITDDSIAIRFRCKISCKEQQSRLRISDWSLREMETGLRCIALGQCA